MVVGASSTEVETVVIGAGPGGYVAAIRAATLGQKVILVERGQIGGVCLNVGCIPSKALLHVAHRFRQAHETTPFGLKPGGAKLNFAAAQKWKTEKVVGRLTGGIAVLLKKHHVEIIRGSASFLDNETLNVTTDDGYQLLRFENCIIATGSRPVELPFAKFGGRIVDSTGALDLKKIPGKLIVLGGGVIGMEIGSLYQNLGARVVVVEGLDHVLNGFDAEMVSPVVDDFLRDGGQIFTSATAKKVKEADKQVSLTFETGGRSQTVTGDYLLVAVGRRPNTDDLGLNNTDVKIDQRGFIAVDEQMRTNVPHIFAIGDVVPGPMLAHKASFQAKVAAAAISGAENGTDLHLALPAVAYTNLELATVGETLDSIKEKNLDVQITKFPFGANGRALTMDNARGFLRLINNRPTGAILGAQIVGDGAADLIASLSLAIENGLTTRDLALTIQPHPTLAEIIVDAAELADGRPIHL